MIAWPCWVKKHSSVCLHLAIASCRFLKLVDSTYIQSCNCIPNCSINDHLYIIDSRLQIAFHVNTGTRIEKFYQLRVEFPFICTNVDRSCALSKLGKLSPTKRTIPSLEIWVFSHSSRHRSSWNHSSCFHLWTMYPTYWELIERTLFASFLRIFFLLSSGGVVGHF